MRTAFAVAALVLAGACASGTSATSSDKGTRYRRGDFVVYRYEGSYRAQPVILREEVVQQEGRKLVIEVSLDGGDVKRSWRMHLTDTPENQALNKIDRLEERAGDAWVTLSNENNRDILRMFEGTYVLPDGPAVDVKTAAEPCQAGRRKLTCEVQRGVQSVGGRACDMMEARSGDFVWTNVAAEYRAKDDGELIYRVTVVDSGP